MEKTTKILKVYLEEDIDDKYRSNTNYHALKDFEEALAFYKELKMPGATGVLGTTCLAALNFDNLKYFDKIILYLDKSNKIYFTLQDDTKETMGSFSIVKYEHIRYTENLNEIHVNHEKELRVCHNLLRLVLNRKFDE